jgi:hypothetical protein
MVSKNDCTDCALGAGAGYLTYKGANKYSNKLKANYAKKVMTNMQNLSQAESATLRKAVVDAFEVAGLETKGCMFHNVNPDNMKSMDALLTKNIKDRIMNLKIAKKFAKLKPLSPEEEKQLEKVLSDLIKNKKYKEAWKEFKKAHTKDSVKSSGKIIETDKSISKILKTVAEGKNAFYHPISKDIMVNVDKLGSASFHEMGHALNASGSKFLKALSIGRHVTKRFVPVILAVGLLKSNKKDGQEPNGVIDKTTTFIKNNVGKLTFAALIPTLAEEGIASIRGSHLAKKVLSPEVLKKLNKSYFLAWTTYLLASLLAAGTVKLSTVVRDKIAEK